MEGRLARIVAVLAVVSCVWMAEGKKADGPKTKLPEDKLFSDQAAFCEGCYAVVHELDALLTKWQKEKGSLEDHIDAALLAICSTDRLRSYVLSPPKMTRLCSGIRVHYLDDLGMAFMKKYARKEDLTADEIFEATCRKIIPACPYGMKPMSVARKEKREEAEAEKKAKENKEKSNKKEAQKQDKNTKKKEKKSKNKTTAKDEL
ncbi:uncharacterized protein LOC119598901 [Penaeus monodon]|uniref:uncharacterized protein LOC119598901 n=1 Tax=Penaeus monodon TaxID=6687 RepID=UPI0018A6E565|nr:uncharacterized protein LOC119598901 [Penaeus monodon]